MATDWRCAIWNTPANWCGNQGRDGVCLDSLRAGGKYFISNTAQVLLDSNDGIDDHIKARLTTWLIQQRQNGDDCPEILYEIIEQAKVQQNLPIIHRADQLLNHIGKKVAYVGDKITYQPHQKLFEHTNLDPSEENYLELLAFSECVNSEELDSLIVYLENLGYIQCTKMLSSRKVQCAITVIGYERIESFDGSYTHKTTIARTVSMKSIENNTDKVFVIHGHDESARESVARLLEKAEIEFVILHEQPNKGRTIIEKFEGNSDVGFAIVLLTPDDLGAAKGSEPDFQPRARQNVVFEFGYFTGKLGRERVCALVKGDLENPSDLHGILYVPLDNGGAWKMQLIRELKNAGFDIDANKVF